MSMDPNKWVSTLPNINFNNTQEDCSSNADRWINTLPRINTRKSLKKYSLTTILFVLGLILVSVIKNETRNLQKEINNLTTSINIIKYSLHLTNLDHEIITSPENISHLAKEYLESELIPYKKKQIRDVNEDDKNMANTGISKNNKSFKDETEDLKEKIKIKIVKKIDEKNGELKKLENLYSKPEKLHSELKLQVTKKIGKTTTEIKQLYNNPNNPKNPNNPNNPNNPKDEKKVSRWILIQILKTFLGMPAIPGK